MTVVEVRGGGSTKKPSFVSPSDFAVPGRGADHLFLQLREKGGKEGEGIFSRTCGIAGRHPLKRSISHEEEGEKKVNGGGVVPAEALMRQGSAASISRPRKGKRNGKNLLVRSNREPRADARPRSSTRQSREGEESKHSRRVKLRLLRETPSPTGSI